MINPILSFPEYQSSVYPKEKIYYSISVLFSVVFWFLIVLWTMGIWLFYTVFFAIFITIGHAIFLSYIKWYGIKVGEKQFSDIFKLAQNSSEKLGFNKVPDIYVYNMDGIFNAFATHFFSRNFVIITTAVMDACNNDMSKLEFVVAHELVHLQRWHTRKQFFLFPSKIIPWLGNAYSRACEYTCDGIAGKYIIDNKDQAIQGILLLPTANAKRSEKVDIDSYEEQRLESGGFWMTLVQTWSTHPFTFNRVAFVRSLFGDKTENVSHSFFGMLLSPLFSLWGWGNWIQVLVVIAIVGILAAALFPSLTKYLERSRQQSEVLKTKSNQQQIKIYDPDVE